MPPACAQCFVAFAPSYYQCTRPGCRNYARPVPEPLEAVFCKPRPVEATPAAKRARHHSIAYWGTEAGRAGWTAAKHSAWLLEGIVRPVITSTLIVQPGCQFALRNPLVGRGHHDDRLERLYKAG